MLSLAKIVAGRTKIVRVTISDFDPFKIGEVTEVIGNVARIVWEDNTMTDETISSLTDLTSNTVALALPPVRPFAHGRHAMYYPEGAKDLDDMIVWGEEVIIEEVIDPREVIAVRPLNSDAVFTVHPDRLSDPYGAPCECARVGGDAFPC